MKVNVLFFGATADTVGNSKFELELSDGANATTALNRIFEQFPSLSSNHKRESLHFSVNQEYASGDELVREGDELAVFTAVSGG